MRAQEFEHALAHQRFVVGNEAADGVHGVICG
jgi:hypothetical protein